MAFFTDITLGQYIPTGSVIHRLDPRAKLLSFLFLVCSVMMVKQIWCYLFFLLLLALLIWLSKLPPAYPLRNLKSFIWLFVITILLHLFFSQGRAIPLFPLNRLGATYEGLIRGVFFCLRVGILILWAALLTLTTSPVELTDGVESLLRPLKKLGFPSQELAMIIMIALRFVPLLVEETETLKKAQLARGADFGGNILQRVKSLIPLIVPLFLSTFRRADELALAMEARCYRGGKGRTSYRKLKFEGKDLLALSLSGVILIGGIFL